MFWVVTLLERLEGSHEIMPTRDTVRNDALRDTSCNGSFDNGSDGVHGSHHLGLELRWDMELDLLEEVFGSTETTDNQDILLSLVFNTSVFDSQTYL